MTESEEYREARREFARIMGSYCPTKDNALRTAADTLLICFDNMLANLERREQPQEAINYPAELCASVLMEMAASEKWPPKKFEEELANLLEAYAAQQQPQEGEKK